jgi:hypothetical protein
LNNLVESHCRSEKTPKLHAHSIPPSATGPGAVSAVSKLD